MYYKLCVCPPVQSEYLEGDRHLINEHEIFKVCSWKSVNGKMERDREGVELIF